MKNPLLLISPLLFLMLTGCEEEKSKVSSGKSQEGFATRNDIETGEDGITRLKGKTEPFSGAVMQRTKEWTILYQAGYLNGKLNGPELRYYPDGVTIKRWLDWVAGDIQRHRDFYENGQISLDSLRKDGKAHGMHRTWSEDGMLRFDGGFIGELQWHGRIVDRNEKGEIMWDAEFDHGKYIGGIYPKDAEEGLIKSGLIDPVTLKPTANQ